MPQSSDAPAERARVQLQIGGAIEEWCRERQRSGQTRFHGAELESAICAATGCTPGSPLRIFREAVRHRLIAARLVSRTDSLYELGSPPLSLVPPTVPPGTRTTGSAPPPPGWVGRSGGHSR